MNLIIENTQNFKRTGSGCSEIHIDTIANGFSIEYPILSLDALDEANFNFCSSVSELFFAPASHAPKRQTVLSQEAFNFLKWKGISGNFLPCPYFRPISLGSLTVELLPSGEGCGSSFLQVRKGNESVFYAHNWTSFESKALRANATKEADTLILRLKQSPQTLSHVASKKELVRSLELIQKISTAGKWAIAVCDSFGPMQIMLNEIYQRKVPSYLDSKAYKTLQWLKIDTNPDELAKWINHPKKLLPNLESELPGLILLSKENLKSIRWLQLPEAVWFWIGEDLEENLIRGPKWLAGISFSETFSIHFLPDMTEIQSLVHELKPSKILVSGEGSEFVAGNLNKHGHHAFSLAPRQQTLF